MTDRDLQSILDTLDYVRSVVNNPNQIVLKEIVENSKADDEVKSSAIMLFDNSGSPILNKDDLISNIKIGYQLEKLGEDYLSDENYEVAGKSFVKALAYGSIGSATSLIQMINDGWYEKPEQLTSFLNTLTSNLGEENNLFEKLKNLSLRIEINDPTEARHISSDLRFEIEHVLRTITGSKMISNALIRTAYDEGYIGLNDQKTLMSAYSNLSDVLHSSSTLDCIDECIDCLEDIKLNHPEQFKVKVKFCSGNKVFKEYILDYGESIPRPQSNPVSPISGYQFKEWSGYNSGLIATRSREDEEISFTAVFEHSDTKTKGDSEAVYWKKLAFSYLNEDHEYVSEDTDIFSEAYRCFRNSAELGDQDSRFNIALLIENKLVKEPLLKAFEIYFDMSRQGDAEASAKVQELISSKDPELYSELYSFYNSRRQYEDAKKFKKYSSIYQISEKKKVQQKPRPLVKPPTASHVSDYQVNTKIHDTINSGSTNRNTVQPKASKPVVMHSNVAPMPKTIYTHVRESRDYENPNYKYRKLNLRGSEDSFWFTGHTDAFER